MHRQPQNNSHQYLGESLLKTPIMLEEDNRKKEYIQYLAMANAMITPLPKPQKNCTIDRHSRPKIIGNFDSIAIRDKFMNFIKNLYLMVNPVVNINGIENGLMGSLLKNPQFENNEFMATEHMLGTFATTVYSIVFCDWADALEVQSYLKNIKRKISIGNQQQEICYEQSIPNANRKLL